jgi:hypothetical protein
MKRLLPLLLLSLAVAIVTAVRMRDGAERLPIAAPDAEQPEQSVVEFDSVQTSTRSVAEEREASTGEGESAELPPGFATRTSWTNPYEEAVWNAPNWRFDEDAMTALPSRDGESRLLCTAEFLRDWNSFTAAFRVELPTVTESGIEAAQRLRLEVAGPKSVDIMRLTLRSDRVILENVHDGEAVPLRETELAEDDDSGSVRLSLTPNRFLVRVGNRLVVNDPRLSALTGETCRFRVSAPSGSIISELRFDGE